MAALSSLSAAVSRVAVAVNSIWTPPWSGLAHILFGPDSSSSSSSSSRNRRSGRRHRRSRSCPRVPSAIRSSIPPPHSYAFRDREQGDLGQTSYPPFFFQSGVYDRTFGYSILNRDGRESGSRSAGRRHRRTRFPLEDDREKNFLSALLSILVIATLATALTQPKWFSVRGGVCGRKYIGLQLFIEFGPHAPGSHSSSSRSELLPEPQSARSIPSPGFLLFDQQPHLSGHNDSDDQNSSHIEDLDDSDVNNSLLSSGAVPKTDSVNTSSGRDSDHDPIRPSLPKKWSAAAVKKACSFSEILPLQRGIVIFSLMAIVVNLVQFFLDTLGTSKQWLDSVRLYALGSIFGVIFTIFIIGISYMIATIIEVNEKSLVASSTRETIEAASHLEVRFELSYYLVTLSGLIGLLAAACNLLRKPTMFFLSSADARNPLIDFYPRTSATDPEPLTPVWSGAYAGGTSPLVLPVQPPPPYSP